MSPIVKLDPWSQVDELFASSGILRRKRTTVAERIEQQRCEVCGHDRYTVPDGIKDCAHDCCVSFYCQGCGKVHGGMGPAACPCGCEDIEQVQAGAVPDA